MVGSGYSCRMATQRFKEVPSGHPAQMLVAYGLITLILGGVILALGLFAPGLAGTTALVIIGSLGVILGGVASIAGRAVIAALTPLTALKDDAPAE